MPRSITASWEAHFVTSYIHGNSARLRRLRSRRNAASVGAGRDGSACRASYCRRHCDSAQFQEKRATPEARRK